MKVGISILTNNKRYAYLRECVSSFLENCYFRPLIIGIYDNGSTDETYTWMQNLPEVYGVTWRIGHSSVDKGCAAGTNASIELVRDCDLILHLESDFRHLTPKESGVDKLWLHRACKFMMNENCDYLYLRRMMNEHEMIMHWWSQWMPKITKELDEYVFIPDFWWSNNPALFSIEKLYEAGTLPLDENKDGEKGTANWSRPELEAKKPMKPWIYRWGMFVHEHSEHIMGPNGCGIANYGNTSCKYGFWKSGNDDWCRRCRRDLSYVDMLEHHKRFCQK